MSRRRLTTASKYIDRLWPRGWSRQTFHYDWWDKEIAPSTELREWFHVNQLTEWTEFEKRYIQELSANPAFANLQNTISDKSKVTLLYSSRDEVHNNAVAVRNLLLKLSAKHWIEWQFSNQCWFS